jgi:hypothetical protein
MEATTELESHQDYLGANLPDLPTEIQKHISSFLDNKARRSMRLASIYWFNMVDYREFSIYFAQPSTVPEIVDRFAANTRPIALRFVKERRMDLSDLLKQVRHLTNLTGLSFTHAKRLHAPDSFSLSALTNLKEWFNMPTYAGKDILENFTQLTSLSVNEWTDESLKRILRSKPMLERLWLGPVNVDNGPRDITESLSLLSNPSLLTSFRAPEGCLINSEFYSKLGNLQHISVQGCKDYSKLTALRSVEVQLENSSYLDQNTKLTRIVLVSTSTPEPSPWLEKLAQFLPKMVNLKYFLLFGACEHFELLHHLPMQLKRLQFTGRSQKLPNLTRLTNLEDLLISRIASVPQPDVTLEYTLQNLTKLTKLALLFDINTTDSLYTSHITNLKSLILRGDLASFMTADVATKLTDLEELRLAERMLNYFVPNTRVLEEPNCYHTILTHFVHLTRLQIRNRSPDLWHTLTKLTHLKTLTIGSIDSTDMHALTALTALTELTIHNCEWDRDVFSKLTNLQHVALHYTEEEEKYMYSHLPYLHTLEWLKRANV